MGQTLEGIADPANLAFAWGKVRANAGADGAAWAADPAGQTIAAFESDAEYQLAALRCAPAGTGRSHPGAKVASRGQGRIQDGGFCLCAATWTTCNEVVQSLRCEYWLRSVLGRARGIRSVRIAGVSGGVGSTVPIAPSPRTIG